MKNKSKLDRLFEAAAKAPRATSAEVPFALEARILAQWRAGGLLDEDPFLWILFFRRAFVGACVVMLLSLLLSYPALHNESRNELAIAEQVLQSSILP